MPRFDDAPVTWIILVAYLGMAALTGIFSPSTESLVQHGAAVGLIVPDEPWRLLSYAFLHGGLMHLAFNAMTLTFIGPALEKSLGGERFVALYVVTSIVGGVFGTTASSDLTPLVGGSGALFGMFGATIAHLMRLGRSQLEFLDYHGPRSLVTLVFANLVLGFLLPMVSNSAHIGGLIAGFVFVYVFVDRGRRAPDLWTRVTKAGWIAIGLALVTYAMRPVLSEGWSIRQAIHASTVESRAAHERRLNRMGFELDQIEDELRTHLPELWGETGMRTVKRLFD